MRRLWDKYVSAHKRVVNALGIEQDTRSLSELARDASKAWRSMPNEARNGSKSRPKAKRPKQPSLLFGYLDEYGEENQFMLSDWIVLERTIEGNALDLTTDDSSFKERSFRKDRIVEWAEVERETEAYFAAVNRWKTDQAKLAD